jgi:hypothetical protein
VLYPEQVLVLFFVIPLRAKYLLLFSALLAVFGIVFPANDTGGPRIADAAHLGGMLTGVFFVRYALLWTWRWPQFTRARSQPPRRLVEVRSPPTASWARTKHPVEDELPPEEFLSKEVDPILDKISAHGIQSLTERERRILEAAREKMAKR